MGEVLPDVNVLGSFPTRDDVVAPFDARGLGVVLVDRARSLLGEAHALEQVAKVQDFSSSRACTLPPLL